MTRSLTPLRSRTRLRHTLLAALTFTIPVALLAGAGTAAASPAARGIDTVTAPTAKLALGAKDLPETRTSTQLAPGVTRTSISRGTANNALFWSVEVSIPAPGTSASAVSAKADAESVAAQLRSGDVPARVEQVTSPRVEGGGGDLGFRVRAGHFAAKADAAVTIAKIAGAGFTSSAAYVGWDGDTASADQSRGPWKLEVITIDPRLFRGDLTSSFGPDLAERETTSWLGVEAGAVAAVNGGFFVLDPKSGAPGDPAGASVHDGKTLSEPVGDRPALVLNRGHSTVQRLTWRGSVAGPDARLAVAGLDRVPGLIRNCGAGQSPGSAPRHDATCTAANEIVAFTPEFGSLTPIGPGLEVVLDSARTVTAVAETRGTRVPPGGSTLQAIGSEVDTLRTLAPVGAKLTVRTELLSESGTALTTTPSTDVVNGGPLLIRDGVKNVTAARDGMVRADDRNNFYYGWAHKRNPRTLAGVDGLGRTLLVTADGRQADSLGLSIAETADVAASLGMVDALNLDGGGSTTMAVDGRVVNSPSDATGERPVGDALLILPRATK